MRKSDVESPDFATREEAAKRLNLSRRQVDRLVANGTLPAKVRSSPGRSGFPRDALEEYIASRKRASAGAPDYGSPCRMLGIGLDEASGDVGAAVDRWLSANGFKGCLVFARGRHLEVIWAASLGYEAAAMRKALQAL